MGTDEKMDLLITCIGLNLWIYFLTPTIIITKLEITLLFKIPDTTNYNCIVIIIRDKHFTLNTASQGRGKRGYTARKTLFRKWKLVTVRGWHSGLIINTWFISGISVIIACNLNYYNNYYYYSWLEYNI